MSDEATCRKLRDDLFHRWVIERVNPRMPMDPGDRLLVDHHLEECPGCRKVFDVARGWFSYLADRMRREARGEPGSLAYLAGIGTGEAVSKAVGGKPPRKPRTGDWGHEVAGMAPADHDAHLRHHEAEYQALQAALATGGDDEERRKKVAGKMRQCASHWHRHRLARHAPEAPKVGLRLGKSVGGKSRLHLEQTTETRQGKTFTSHRWKGDPALDPERVGRMAEGFNAAADREREVRERLRAERAPEVEARVAHREANRETWQTVEGVEVLRINDSPFVAVPCTGRKGSPKFDIIDLRSRTHVAQLKKQEVAGWLYKQVEKSISVSDGVSEAEARALGEKLGVDWGEIPLAAFRRGVAHEREHSGTVGGDPLKIARTALDHLRERADYYDVIEDALGERTRPGETVEKAKRGAWAWGERGKIARKASEEEPAISDHLAAAGAVHRESVRSHSDDKSFTHRYEHEDPVKTGQGLVSKLTQAGWHHRKDEYQIRPGGWESGSHSSGGWAAEFRHPETGHSHEVQILPPTRQSKKVAKGALDAGPRGIELIHEAHRLVGMLGLPKLSRRQGQGMAYEHAGTPDLTQRAAHSLAGKLRARLVSNVKVDHSDDHSSVTFTEPSFRKRVSVKIAHAGGKQGLPFSPRGGRRALPAS